MTFSRTVTAVQLVFLLSLLSVSVIVNANDSDKLVGPAPTILWGRVAEVVPSQGHLVLAYEDGTWAELVSDPRLLRNIRPGQTVQAVLDGRVLRFVEPVGAPSTRA